MSPRHVTPALFPCKHWGPVLTEASSGAGADGPPEADTGPVLQPPSDQSLNGLLQGYRIYYRELEPEAAAGPEPTALRTLSALRSELTGDPPCPPPGTGAMQHQCREEGEGRGGVEGRAASQEQSGSLWELPRAAHPSLRRVADLLPWQPPPAAGT